MNPEQTVIGQRVIEKRIVAVTYPREKGGETTFVLEDGMQIIFGGGTDITVKITAKNGTIEWSPI